ncbi:hypothetical protein KSP40_PGU022350 [Platanthera guangdongensis]|uniref:Uncharacterized protein n=1 Tax=Platanthera guangdongensis TaxID=2320717 RepID=A0ABR2M2N6_9ASPA
MADVEVEVAPAIEATSSPTPPTQEVPPPSEAPAVDETPEDNEATIVSVGSPESKEVGAVEEKQDEKSVAVARRTASFRLTKQK